MEQLRLEPISRVNGSVTLPGSKSLSNRILLLAALAQGTTVVENLLDSDDIRHMLGALKHLGVNVTLNTERTVATVEGVSGVFNTPTEPLFLGNAGTAYRPLTAVLAAIAGEYELIGEPRMEERPIGHLVDALQALGGDVSYLKNKDYPPLKIIGGQIAGGEVEIDGSISSQFLTALLMAAPLFKGDTYIKIKGTLVSKPYIDITVNEMRKRGLRVRWSGSRDLAVESGSYSAGEYSIEGDATAASYFSALATIHNSAVNFPNLGSNTVQGDYFFFEDDLYDPY